MTGRRTVGQVLRDGAVLCLGIDPHPHLLGRWDLDDAAVGVREFGLRAVDAAHRAGVPVLKPQVAFFERHGSAGFQALERVLQEARGAGAWTIADAKRGDIGSTMAGYASAWLRDGSPLAADALTVSPYLGVGSLAPAFEAADATGRTLFVLAATSNPEAEPVQSARTDSGLPLAADILEAVVERSQPRNDDTLLPHGVVVGATVGDEMLGRVADGAEVPVLAPGFGAQGAELRQLRRRFGRASSRVIANVSRQALEAGPEGLADRLRRLGDELREGAA